MKNFFDIINYVCHNYPRTRIRVHTDAKDENLLDVSPYMYDDVLEAMSECFSFTGTPDFIDLFAEHKGRIRVVLDKDDMSFKLKISNYKFRGSEETRTYNYSELADGIEFIGAFLSAPKLSYDLWNDNVLDVLEQLAKYYYQINLCKVTLATGYEMSSNDGNVRDLLKNVADREIKSIVFETKNGFTVKYMVRDSEYTSDGLIEIQESFIQLLISGLGII
ncbi:MAG: hypothetical protein MJ154_03385 [Candidatus Saccharibacteria bacterium]|nr:hypothetical protein [Candidatus Saccharibacteria bacterium]